MTPELEVMILTQRSRSTFLNQLFQVLRPQLNASDGRAVASVRQFDHTMSLGENREAMRRAAVGEYICFVDDDDLVARNYVSEILKAATWRPDQITFEVQVLLGDDLATAVTIYQSLAYSGWRTDTSTFNHYRDISHLCPMRRELALKVPMSGGIGEDYQWAKAMRDLDVVNTEQNIPAPPLYYYWLRSRRHDALDPLRPKRLKLLDDLKPAAL